MAPRRGQTNRPQARAQARAQNPVNENPVPQESVAQSVHPEQDQEVNSHPQTAAVGLVAAQGGIPAPPAVPDFTQIMAMMEEFQRFRAMFGNLPNPAGVAGGVPIGAGNPQNVPPAQEPGVNPPPPPVVMPQAYQTPPPVYPPPPPAVAPPVYPPVIYQQPPPPQNQFQQRPTYWEMVNQLRNMGTEMFDGQSGPTAADNWRRKLEHNLNHLRCPEEYRRDLATQYLKDEALLWWENQLAQTRGQFELTWDDFKARFQKKFFPREMMDNMENAFTDLRQKELTVRAYASEFNRLRRFSTRYMDEEELIRRFMNGLRIELRNRCKMRDYQYLDELIEKAADQEDGLTKERNMNRGTQVRTERAPEKTAPRQVTTPVTPAKTRCNACGLLHFFGPCPRCFKCNQTGHRQYDCPFYPTPLQAAPAPVTCFRCGKKGHMAKACTEEPRQLAPAPPPKRQVAGPRVCGVGEPAVEEPHEEGVEEQQGAEPIAG